MKKNNWHTCILIPAHNEEKLLPRCLKSVLHAAKQLPGNCTYDIVLAVDASNDRTATIGHQFLEGYGTLIEVDKKQVGYARKQAADTALSRYHGPFENCWIANTDADCEIPSDWLLKQLKLANAGYQAVAGIVDVDSFEEHNSLVQQRFQKTYIINEDGTHPHVHGANLGIRADSYLQVGGWSCLKTAEDHDLWNRMKLHKFMLKADANLLVITSGRKIGRAPDGFAQALAAHNRYSND